METKLLIALKDYWPIILVCATIISTTSITLRDIRQLKKTIMGNGVPGLVQRMEGIEVNQAVQMRVCEERHPHGR